MIRREVPLTSWMGLGCEEVLPVPHLQATEVRRGASQELGCSLGH